MKLQFWGGPNPRGVQIRYYTGISANGASRDKRDHVVRPYVFRQIFSLLFKNYKLKGCVHTAPGKFENGVFFNLSASKDLRPHGKTDKKIRIHTATMVHWINA